MVGGSNDAGSGSQMRCNDAAEKSQRQLAWSCRGKSRLSGFTRRYFLCLPQVSTTRLVSLQHSGHQYHPSAPVILPRPPLPSFAPACMLYKAIASSSLPTSDQCTTVTTSSTSPATTHLCPRPQSRDPRAAPSPPSKTRTSIIPTPIEPSRPHRKLLPPSLKRPSQEHNLNLFQY
ncbi:hypothetical protein EJ04DRAFT_228531 [Polyplosphaeria fusca]|uniref:Uncharacterized protein n=1 Tax=Polyplosphaeria fusca TaxID=682080 RepID=A0A9P4R0Z1_9PLEO|nr:hypothetical protein EJ04DRAFT_228531 [Polyplosphaeria fusca]